VPQARHSAKFFPFLKKNITLPSAAGPTLGKVFPFFKKTLLCRVPQGRHLAIFFSFLKKTHFVECPLPGHSAKTPRIAIFLFFYIPLLYIYI
jgi:hypothetical protein